MHGGGHADVVLYLYQDTYVALPKYSFKKMTNTSSIAFFAICVAEEITIFGKVF